MGVLPTCMLTHPVQPDGEQMKAAYLYSETQVLWGAPSAYNCFSAESSVQYLSYHELEMPLCPLSEVCPRLGNPQLSLWALLVCGVCWEATLAAVHLEFSPHHVLRCTVCQGSAVPFITYVLALWEHVGCTHYFFDHV